MRGAKILFFFFPTELVRNSRKRVACWGSGDTKPSNSREARKEHIQPEGVTRIYDKLAGSKKDQKTTNGQGKAKKGKENTL